MRKALKVVLVIVLIGLAYHQGRIDGVADMPGGD